MSATRLVGIDEATRILECSQREARRRLEKIRCHEFGGHQRKTFMWLRRDVERIARLVR